MNMEIPQLVKDSISATKVDYVQLGKSGLRVSVPILGAMSFGDSAWAPWVIDEEKVSLPPRSILTCISPTSPEGEKDEGINNVTD
jgi:hypothetical protein